MSEDMTGRPGWDGDGTYLQCPLCPAIVRMPDPDETPMLAADWAALDGSFQASVLEMARQAQEAGEALFLFHLECDHTMREIAIALGSARNVIRDIEEALANDDIAKARGVIKIARMTHGLGP